MSDAIDMILANAIQTQATKPQKTSSTTYTSPIAIEDMISVRDALSQAMKSRQGFGYNFANALSGIETPREGGTGAGLANFAKAFGSAYNGRQNAQINNLAQELINNKMLGDKTTEIIGYGEFPSGSTSSKAPQQPQIPVIDPGAWNTMISNFDKGRPTESDYRKQTQQSRKLRNMTMFMGDSDENYAREQFDRYRGQDFLPLARGALKGSGAITDFEDKKYTEWLNKVKDPVQLKDVAVKIINDAATKNDFSPQQKNDVLSQLGLTSTKQNLLPAQIANEPARVEKKGNNSNIEELIKRAKDAGYSDEEIKAYLQGKK